MLTFQRCHQNLFGSKVPTNYNLCCFFTNSNYCNSQKDDTKDADYTHPISLAWGMSGDAKQQLRRPENHL